MVEPTGADTQLYCRFMDQDVTATIRERTNVRAGRPHHARCRIPGARTCSMPSAAKRLIAGLMQRNTSSDHHRRRQHETVQATQNF